MLLESSIMLLETFIVQASLMTFVIYDCHIFIEEATGDLIQNKKRMISN